MDKNNRECLWRERTERDSDITEILTYLISLLPEGKLKMFSKWLDCYIYFKENAHEFNYIFNVREVYNHIHSKQMEDKYNGNSKSKTKAYN